MVILFWGLLGALIASAFAFIIWFLCLLCNLLFNLNSDKLNLCTKMTMYSLLIAVISFMCIILIKA